MCLIEILYLISCDFHGQTTTTTTKTNKHSCVPRDEIFFGIIACRPNRLLESLGVVEGELGQCRNFPAQVVFVLGRRKSFF